MNKNNKNGANKERALGKEQEKTKGRAESAKTVKNSEFVGKDQFNNYEAPMPKTSRKSIKARYIQRLQNEYEYEQKRQEEAQRLSEESENAKESQTVSANKKVITIVPNKPKENLQESEKELPDEEKNRETISVKEAKEDSSKENNTKKKQNSIKKDKASENSAENSEHKKNPVKKQDKKNKGAKPPKRPEKKKEADDIINITDIRQARKREKRKKYVKKSIVAGIIAVFGLSVYFTRGVWVPKLEGILDKPHATIVNDGETQKGNFPIEVDEDSDTLLTEFGNYLISVDKNHILMYDENGAEAGSFSHMYASPAVNVSSKRVLVYDVGGNSFQVLTRKKEVYSKKLDKSILMAKIADNGNAIVASQSDKYECTITVYDSNGSEIYSWESGRVLNFTFTDDGAGCYVSTFSSGGGDIKSVIYQLDFSKESPVMKSEPLTTLALDVCKANDKCFWVVGDNRFYKLGPDGKVLMDYEYLGQLEGYAIGEKGAAVAYKGVTRNGSNIVFFKSSSEDNKPHKIVNTDNGSPKKFKYVNGVLTLLKNDTMEAYDVSGNLLATAAVSSDYTDFVLINQNAYFMSKNAINKIEFKTD